MNIDSSPLTPCIPRKLLLSTPAQYWGVYAPEKFNQVCGMRVIESIKDEDI
jgi:hypothetical protein